ncbi:hypothetical protein UlMin_030240 [Ulmus minor]
MVLDSVEELPGVRRNAEQNSTKEELNVVKGIEPYVGQLFDTEEAAHSFYSRYGMRMGFITRIHDLYRSKQDGTIIGRTLVCNKQGYRRSNKCDEKNRKPGNPTRVGCKAMLSVRRLSTGKWVVNKFVKEHTHSLAAYCENGSINDHTPFLQTESARIRELTQQLLLERKRCASFRKIIDLLFNHIEEHTQGLSKTIQSTVDQVKEIESKGINPSEKP